MENLLSAGRSERDLRTYRHSHSPAFAQTDLAGMEASQNSGSRAQTQRTAKRTSMEIVRQWTRPMAERQRPSHAQSISQQRLSTNGALQSLVKGLTTESTPNFRNRRMPNGTSGGVGGSEVQTRSLPDLGLKVIKSSLNPSFPAAAGSKREPLR